MITTLLILSALAADPTCVSIATDAYSDGREEWQIAWTIDGAEVAAFVHTLQAAMVLTDGADPGSFVYDDFRDSDFTITEAAMDCADSGGPIGPVDYARLVIVWEGLPTP